MNNEEISRLEGVFRDKYEKANYKSTDGRYIKVISHFGGFSIGDTIERRRLNVDVVNEKDCDKLIQALNFMEETVDRLKLLIRKK